MAPYCQKWLFEWQRRAMHGWGVAKWHANAIKILFWWQQAAITVLYADEIGTLLPLSKLRPFSLPSTMERPRGSP